MLRSRAPSRSGDLNLDRIRLESASIRRVAAMVAMSPALRAFLVRVLNRVPRVKRRLKRMLVRADTVVSQDTGAHASGPGEEMLMSCEARRVLRDLAEERARADVKRGEARRR